MAVVPFFQLKFPSGKHVGQCFGIINHNQMERTEREKTIHAHQNSIVSVSFVENGVIIWIIETKRNHLKMRRAEIFLFHLEEIS